MYNIVIHNFKGYTPVTVTIKYWLYSLCCSKYLHGLFILYVVACEKWNWKSLSCVWLFVTSWNFVSPWNSPGQNTSMGSLSLLLGIFPTQGLKPGLPHWRWILYQLSHKEKPKNIGIGSLSLLWGYLLISYPILPPPSLSPLVTTSFVFYFCQFISLFVIFTSFSFGVHIKVITYSICLSLIYFT